MGIENLPAAVVRGSALARTGAVRSGTLIQGAARVAPSVPARSMKTIEGVARSVKEVKPGSPFYKKQVVIGGTAVLVSALAGMGIDDLVDTLNPASQEEIEAIMFEADNGDAVAVADALSEVYNEIADGATSFMTRDQLEYSQADGDMVAFDSSAKAGIGIDVAAIDRMQVHKRSYGRLRYLGFEMQDILYIQHLANNATPDDIRGLEDLHNGS